MYYVCVTSAVTVFRERVCDGQRLSICRAIMGLKPALQPVATIASATVNCCKSRWTHDFIRL